MLVRTKYFGSIDLDESKIITLENGLMGFEQYKKYTILYDMEGEEIPAVSWFQSLEEPGLSIPVISPSYVKEKYNPIVEDELLAPLGELSDENLIILLTLTVPADPKNTTTNLKAPIIINSDTRRGCQIIVDNQDYAIKYNIYDAMQKLNAEKGGSIIC